MKPKRTVKAGQSCSLALIAAALQDHRTRSRQLMRPGPNILLDAGATRWSPPQIKDIKAVVDTGLKQKVEKPSKFGSKQVEKEYVLDCKQTLSLAQKLGIADCPSYALTENEWKGIKEKSNKRLDSRQPCAICKEKFGMDAQVLLSCSHVFHKVCLQAFERYAGRKTCPLCRQNAYQTRVIHEGKRFHYSQSATKIQAAWRGYVVRSWYRKLREVTPPQNPLLRKQFFEKKLKDITDRMVKSFDVNVDEFLAEIDENIATQRQIIGSYINCYIDPEEWKKIKYKALQRGNLECSICVTSISTNMDSKIPGLSCSSTCVSHPRTDKEDLEKPRAALLLSCTHVFHQACLETFEAFTEGVSQPVCPLCRSLYNKKLLASV